MPQDSYYYAVGRIRVKENKLMDSDKIERMLDMESIDDVLKVLIESEYGTGEEVESPHDYEQLLSAELKKVYDFIEEVTPNKELTDLFSLQYDIHNIKSLIKARFLENHGDLPLATTISIPIEDLTRAVNEGQYDGIPEYLAKALALLEETFEQGFDPHRVETSLDNLYFKRVFEVLKKNKNPFMHELFAKRVDLTNIRTLLRVKSIKEDPTFLKDMLIEGGSLEADLLLNVMEDPLEELLDKLKGSEYIQLIADGIRAFDSKGEFTLFERQMDNHLLNFVKQRKYNPMGMEAIAGYLLAKENEIKLVRMIMVGKSNKIPKDTIRERLRDVYV
ncbi:MAG TPA: V-type ATP synthase subunit C [Bacillota bacterium]|nr:V-type ATP synthase subunit C [Bacillota bacterium]